MLANTYTLTIGSESPITLTRVREDGGQSTYLYRSPGVQVTLKIRQSVQKSGGVQFNTFNAMLEHVIADTPTTVGYTTTASFTGRMESLSDPAFAADLNKALHSLASPIMANLANGEL